MIYEDHLKCHQALLDAMNSDGRAAAKQRQLQAAASKAWGIVHQTIHPELNKLINAFRSVFNIIPIVSISGGSMGSPSPQVIELSVRSDFSLRFTLDPRTELVKFTAASSYDPAIEDHVEEISFDEVDALRIEEAIISFLNLALPIK